MFMGLGDLREKVDPISAPAPSYLMEDGTAHRPGKRTGQRCSGGWDDWPAMGGQVNPAPRPRRGRGASSRAARLDLPCQIRTPPSLLGSSSGSIAGHSFTPNCLSTGNSSGFGGPGPSFDPRVQGSSP